MKVDFSNKPIIDVEATVSGPVGTVGPVGIPGSAGVPGPAVDTTPAEAIPTASANSQPRNLPALPSDAPNMYDDENIGFDDIILPRLNIVHGVGDLSTIFNPGEIVLNQSLVIHVPKNDLKKVAGTKPLSLTVIGFKKRQYVEKTVGGAQGNLFSTTQEVVNAGGTLDYKEAQSTGKTLYQTLATALVLVEKPEQIPDEDRLLFAHECQGKWYSLALWSMKGTAFTHAAKHVFTARKLGHLKTVKDAEGKVASGGYPSYCWSLTTTVQTFGTNPTQIPVLKPGTKNSPEFKEFVGRVLTSGN